MTSIRYEDGSTYRWSLKQSTVYTMFSLVDVTLRGNQMTTVNSERQVKILQHFSFAIWADSRQAAPESFHATADPEGRCTFGSLKETFPKDHLFSPLFRSIKVSFIGEQTKHLEQELMEVVHKIITRFAASRSTWETPWFSAVSYRLPAFTNTPTLDRGE